MKCHVIICILITFSTLIKTQESYVTEIVDDVSKTFLDPFRSSPQETFDFKVTTEMSTQKYSLNTKAQNLYTKVVKYSDESSDSSSMYSESSDSSSSYSETISDYSSTPLETTASSMSSEDNDESSSNSVNTFSQSAPDSQPSLSTDFPTTTETDELVELTSKYHKMRVNFTHKIHAQQKVISKLAETIRGLESDVTKLKITNEHEVKRMKVKNENCRIDYNLLSEELRVAKKLFGMEKYSEGLKRKLSEFGVDESSNITLKFSVFEMESDEFSGKILSNRQLPILPPRLGEIIANVSELSASNIGLVAINRNAFEGMHQLKVLNLSINEISYLETRNFPNLVDLQRLDLSHNKIETIELNAFDALKELQELNLKHNKISKVPVDTFDSLLNLKILILSHNQIRELSEETFTVINVIEEFYINNNRLELIHPSIISDFEVSKVIDFRDNLCIDQRFPENLTMVQLAIEVSEKCWRKV